MNYNNVNQFESAREKYDTIYIGENSFDQKRKSPEIRLGFPQLSDWQFNYLQNVKTYWRFPQRGEVTAAFFINGSFKTHWRRADWRDVITTWTVGVHFLLMTAAKLCWGSGFPPWRLCTCPLHQLFCQLCLYLFSDRHHFLWSHEEEHGHPWTVH